MMPTRLAERALVVVEKVLGPDHPLSRTSSRSWSAMHEGRGRYDEGDALRKRALAIIERAYGGRASFSPSP